MVNVLYAIDGYRTGYHYCNADARSTLGMRKLCVVLVVGTGWMASVGVLGLHLLFRGKVLRALVDLAKHVINLEPRDERAHLLAK